MTEFEPTVQARAAAARATVLAGIARRRTLFASAWNGRALHTIADLLDIVALSLFDEAPTGADGLPDDARAALADAEETAVETPGTGFPRRFGQYVTHVLDVRPLTTEAALGATGCDLGDDDARLTAALGTLHDHLTAAATEEVAQALLEAVFALHDKRADLAQLIQG
ncbi:hypothetical protein ACIGW7_40075 [Streptomyces sp. NPDC053253]|uniref:hypothetical protein n=1 Tax=Streptomyces sp. NPDC053253 TaxID=3365699 RepID=UPI0037D301C3